MGGHKPSRQRRGQEGNVKWKPVYCDGIIAILKKNKEKYKEKNIKQKQALLATDVID